LSPLYQYMTKRDALMSQHTEVPLPMSTMCTLLSLGKDPRKFEEELNQTQHLRVMHRFRFIYRQYLRIMYTSAIATVRSMLGKQYLSLSSRGKLPQRCLA
jgi:hypothetical protein